MSMAKSQQQINTECGTIAFSTVATENASFMAST